MFHVGQKVVCVDDQHRYLDRYPYRAKFPMGLKRGDVYTISALGCDLAGTPSVYLYEIKSSLPPFVNGQERGFDADRFRPLVEKKTDIGFAHEILRKVTRKNKERA